jgi:exopolysaccharide production protein ExoZ
LSVVRTEETITGEGEPRTEVATEQQPLTESRTARPSTSERLPQIQVARALAALAVTFFHSYIGVSAFAPASKITLPFIYEFGFLGVNLFFAISGFIIALVVDRPHFRAAPFLVKRFFRIYPLYWGYVGLAVVLGALGIVLVGSADRSTAMVLWNLAIFPVQGEPLYAVGWSLEHEVIFYALAALSVPLVGIRGLAVIVLSLGGLGFVVPNWEHLLAGAHLDFATGIIIYLARNRLRGLGSVLPVLAAAACYTVFALWQPPFVTLGAEALLVVGLLNIPAGTVVRFLYPLVRIGDASYSLYLVHWLVFLLSPHFVIWADVPEGWAEAYRFSLIGFAIVAAMILYDFVERPFIAFGHRVTAGSKRSLIRSGAHRSDVTPWRIVSIYVLGWFFLTAVGGAWGNTRFVRSIAVSESVDEITALAQNLGEIAPAVAEGSLNLLSLRQIGVKVPSSLIQGSELATRWGGRASIRRDPTALLFDLEEVPEATCRELLVRANDISRVVRVAASAQAADERPVPVSDRQARADCRRRSFVRFVYAVTR